MKKYLSAFALLLLAACIEVGDIGAYWEKGVTDPALTGSWTEEKAQAPEIRAVTIANNEYTIASLDDKSKNAKDYKPVLARTLKVGHYTFFMTEPVPAGDKPDAKKASNLSRYKLEGDRLALYTLQPGPLSDFLQKLKKKHPKEKEPAISIENHAVGKTDKRYVAIGKLDEKVFNILAAIPDNATFWLPAKSYLRQKP